MSNVQLDDNIRIWLLEEEGFKSAPETWKCRRRNDVFGQSIPNPRSRNVEGLMLCHNVRPWSTFKSIKSMLPGWGGQI